MRDNAAGFVGDIPGEYDRGLGPVIFADYAADMARRVAAFCPRRVLETAAGTGIVTRLLRDLLPADAHLTATDLNPPMLAAARGKFRPDEAVEFRPADATALPFPDGAFDAVACQFGAMFFPDKDATFREARRVLAPHGRYVFSVWDAHRHNPFGRIAHAVAGSFFPSDPPGFYAVPFGYHRIDPIKDALLDAGFDGIRIAVVRQEEDIPSAAGFARGLVFGNPLVETGQGARR
jgi:SAM-dependent methyltransferase